MKTALMAALLCLSSPLLAQTPAPSTPASPQNPPAQHQPGMPATPTHVPGQAAKAPAGASDKPDPVKDTAIRKLMDITQTSKLGDSISAYITNQVQSGMRQTLSADVLPKFMDTFNQKFAAAAPATAVTNAVIPIYARAFTLEDIQGLIQFYESPLGQKVVKALPDVTQQSQMVGVQMQQAAAIAVLRAMSDDYP